MENTNCLAVIFGPLSSLGRGLLETKWADKTKLLLVARHQRDKERLAALHLHAEILTAWKESWELGRGYDQVIVFCCTLGMARPRIPSWSDDISEASRDIEFLERILRAYRDLPIHVILVSSILALSPRGKNTYYAGWKDVIMASVECLVHQYPYGYLSVLYPGRLINRTVFHKPSSFFSTTYNRAVKTLLKMQKYSKSYEKIIGLDAHL